MSQKTVLVIDDSATIRRLVDTTLSPVGYAVVLSGTAEEGIDRAREVRPDLIILDHQLPGTTGVEVCSQLLADETLRNIPVIASSTLRKKAYIEYADCPNVVDMLPKPYNAELLVTTVANTLDTAALVVDSQRDGTAVPEILQALGDAALAGDFRSLSLRAVVDFLNNNLQEGTLEIENEMRRVRVFLARGRVQAVTASGIDENEMTEHLPEALQDLGPVLRLTVGSGSCSQVDGLVQLLDNKVLDPRLLKKLLRHQAAWLLFDSFNSEMKTFRFDTGLQPPALQNRLPLDLSVIALLVEACLAMPADRLPAYTSNHQFFRKAIRGQNLDRAGLSAQHQKLISKLSDAVTLSDLAHQVNGGEDEAARVMHALVLADLVEVRVARACPKVVVVEGDPQMTVQLRQASQDPEFPFALKVVRDRLSIQLLLKRQQPNVFVVALDTEAGLQILEEMRDSQADAVWVGVVGDEDVSDEVRAKVDVCLSRPYSVESLCDQLAATLHERGVRVEMPESSQTH